MKSILISFLVLLAASNISYAQSSKEKSKNKQTDYSNSYAPYTPEKENSTIARKKVKKKKKESFRSTYNKSLEKKKVDFQDLMVANAKRKKKEAKKMKKPQYSDPLYFGHKKKPKKRRLGKRKFCKECGIVH